MIERRRNNRRRRMVRNLYAYLNRRILGRKGRRRDEGKYDEVEDWFDLEKKRKQADPPDKG